MISLRHFCFALLFGLLLFGCKTKQHVQSTNNQAADLDQLYDMMTGSFSSAAQAANDSSYFNIHLVMHPIWLSDKSAKWLYVEQAVASHLKKPYRQRVYRLTQSSTGRFESRVYSLPDPEAAIHGWEKPDVFKTFSSADLIEREGCAVFLEKQAGGCFAGSTSENDCKSTLRGAAYATSIVEICKDKVISWDRGFDSNGNHVWGAEKAGYIFDRE